jgi:hypothetical protein
VNIYPKYKIISYFIIYKYRHGEPSESDSVGSDTLWDLILLGLNPFDLNHGYQALQNHFRLGGDLRKFENIQGPRKRATCGGLLKTRGRKSCAVVPVRDCK